MQPPLSPAAQAAQTATLIGANPPRLATFNDRVRDAVLAQRAELYLDLTDDTIQRLAARATTNGSTS